VVNMNQIFEGHINLIFVKGERD